MMYKSRYKKVGVLPIRIAQSNVSSIGPSSERNQLAGMKPTCFTIRIGSTRPVDTVERLNPNAAIG